jgi:tetratricopeptide (TPR) repeat protein
VAYSSEIEKLEKRYAENPRGRNFAPLADAYRKAGEVDKAIELCLNGLERHPDYVSAHIVYGRCLVDQKNDVGAEEVFKKVLSLDPENIIALKVLAELADRGGRPDQAVTWLSRLLAADPMNGDAEESLKQARAKAAAKPAPVEPAAAEEPVVVALTEPEPAPAPAPAPATRPSGVAEPGLIDLDALAVTEAPTAAMTQPSFPPEPPLVEHDEVVLQQGARQPDIETFDGDLGFTSSAGRTEGLVVEESEPLKPDGLTIEGLARTQYEGSGMFRLDAPEGPPPAVDTDAALEVGPAADLPLIMPDDAVPVRRSSAAVPPPPPPRRPSRTSDATPAAVTLSDDEGAADGAALSAAEPVMTETMAELYLRQGHREDALRVYRALLADRPGDARLAAKVRDLEGPSRPAHAATPPLESATAFLRRVWRGAPPPEPEAAAAPDLELTGALEAAFAAAPRVSEAVPQAPDAPGAPTQPAEDVISLDAVFGDQVGRNVASEPVPQPPAPEAPAPSATGGFSFDDFFGAAPSAAGTPARGPRGPRPSRPQPEDEDLDQFQAWLKGLKT